jgi:hypothetical protein
MERDVNTCMQRGAQRADIIAGLAYSIVYNYINRVVRGRPIGDCIFFQGGTAYNDAGAFSIVCDKEIIVPPHNAVLVANGAALLAKEKSPAPALPRAFVATTWSRSNTLCASSLAKVAETCAPSRNLTSRAKKPTGATSARSATASRSKPTASRLSLT